MSAFRSVLTLITTIPRVATRRLLYGPKHPKWGLLMEILVEFLRKESAPLSHLTPEVVQRYRALPVPQSRLLSKLSCQNIQIGEASARWFTPPSHHKAVVLYFHGGIYLFGSHKTHSDLLARLALTSKARVLSLEYRLAPEHPFPAAVEDAVFSYRWLLSQGVQPKEIVLMGDSAGGGLALALLLRLKAEGGPMPAAAALLSPWVDLTCRGESFTTNEPFDYLHQEHLLQGASLYLGSADPLHPHASPLSGDLRGLPPLLIQVGDAEVLLSQGLRLAQKANDAHLEVRCEVAPGMFHDWQLFGYLFEESRQAVDTLAQFVLEKAQS